MAVDYRRCGRCRSRLIFPEHLGHANDFCGRYAEEYEDGNVTKAHRSHISTIPFSSERCVCAVFELDSVFSQLWWDAWVLHTHSPSVCGPRPCTIPFHFLNLIRDWNAPKSNWEEWDYLTETEYKAREAGSIPIYWEFDSIDAFVPWTLRNPQKFWHRE
jgi:hypothetical protein